MSSDTAVRNGANFSVNEKCSFAENILMIVKSLYLRRTYSDITIKIKDNSFPAHKFVLQARSDEWNEEFLQNTDELNWTDLVDDSETVQNLLKWIYTDVIDIQQQDQVLIKLLRAAFKFRLSSLIGICERALMASVSVRSCVSLYCIADEVGASNLRDYCSGLISAHWDELLPQDFKLMSSPLLHSMLKTKSKFPLHDAIKLRRSDVIKTMLENDEDEIKNTLNIVSSTHKHYPLTLALLEKDIEIAKLLIDKGADLNAQDIDGSSLLMSAIIREDLFTAEFLIENSCNLNQINNINGESVLHGMCSIKDRTIRNDIMTIAKKILSRPNVDSNIRNHHGFAPLHIAISCGFTEMIDELMQICDINLETLDGKCCLELALTLDNFDVAAKLVEKGANPNIEMRSGDSLINHMIKSNYENAAVFLCKFVDLQHKNSDGETSLHVAVKKNHSKLAKLMLENGANPNIRSDQGGESALHYAIKNDCAEIIDILAAQNASSQNVDFNLETSAGDSPLSLALSLKRHALVPQLIKGGSNVNARNKDGLSLLHQAILNRSSETAVFLIQNGAHIEETTLDGESPLILSIREECEEVVDILCSKGASMLSGSGTNPLYLALEMRQENVANILVSHGIDLDCWSPVGDGTLETLLHRALRDDVEDEYIATYLIKKGCDIDSPKQHDSNCAEEIVLNRESPLHMCCRLGLHQTCQVLIKSGANLNCLNVESQTPLHVAIKHGKDDIIRLLLDQPTIDLKVRDKSGNTPFALTLQMRNHKIAERILEKMPNAAEQMDSRGRNFLHLAILNEDLETILFLISIQVDVNSRVHDVNQLTPLMLASNSENEMIIRNLILAGARMNDRDSTQRTALHMACERGRLGAVEALIQNNCDFDAVDAQGENALHVSMIESKLEIIRCLLTETRINAEAVNVKGRNPLHELCRCGRDTLAASICELFLECMPRFPINSADNQGNTALLLAYMRGEGSLCRVIVKNNACLGVENNDGVSIFNYKLATNQLLVRLIDELTVEPPWSMSNSCCQECRTKFSLTSRKHHCRCCGRNLCSACSSNDIPIIKFQLNKPVRVCNTCFNILQVGSI